MQDLKAANYLGISLSLSFVHLLPLMRVIETNNISSGGLIRVKKFTSADDFVATMPAFDFYQSCFLPPDSYHTKESKKKKNKNNRLTWRDMVSSEIYTRVWRR